jgi:serine phosphatase RsbU (regulator of sigma subunit)
MLGVSLLNEIVVENNITEVNIVLERMRTQIIKNLKQGEDRSKSKDGMDISLISFDPKTNKLQFAGAGHKLYLAENGECSEIQGDRFPVGYYMGKEAHFSTKEIQLKKNTCIYLSSDGFPDQFGGANRKKYGRNNLIKLFSSIQKKPMEEQKTTIENTLDEWKGPNDQIDDIVVMGIRFPIS